MHGGAVPNPTRRVRCVVWHRPGKTPRPELAAALNRPGFRVFKCDSAWHSLAYLCAREGPAAVSAEESTILIIAEPSDLPDVVELIEAVDRFAPGVTLWKYDSAESPNMRAVTAEDVALWRSTAGRPPAPVLDRPPVAAGSAGPALRLAGEGPLPPPVVPLEAGDPPSPHPDVKFPSRGGSPVLTPEPEPSTPRLPPPLLTDEELHMLLAGDEEKRK